MQCETCHGSGSVGPLPIPCGDCGGSGVAHCCDGLRAQNERTDVAGWVYPSGKGNCTPYFRGAHPAYNVGQPISRVPYVPYTRRAEAQSDPGDETPEAMGCANDCCHPDHRHNVAVADTLYCGECFEAVPDTHDEWREINDAE